MANGGVQVREEVLNVLLAELLEQRGLWSVPESIRRGAGGEHHRLPDVTLADLWGVRRSAWRSSTRRNFATCGR